MNGYAKYRRMCGRKRPFNTEQQALNAGRKYKQRAYECPCCGKWHLTSKPESRERDEQDEWPS